MRHLAILFLVVCLASCAGTADESASAQMGDSQTGDSKWTACDVLDMDGLKALMAWEDQMVPVSTKEELREGRISICLYKAENSEMIKIRVESPTEQFAKVNLFDKKMRHYLANGDTHGNTYEELDVGDGRLSIWAYSISPTEGFYDGVSVSTTDGGLMIQTESKLKSPDEETTLDIHRALLALFD